MKTYVTHSPTVMAHVLSERELINLPGSFYDKINDVWYGGRTKLYARYVRLS